MYKKIITLIIILTFTISTSLALEGVVKTSSKVLVNGSYVDFDAYNIEGNNYFKLRDIAKVLSGGKGQFEVSWDGRTINLLKGQAYTVVGGELEKGLAEIKHIVDNTSPIYIDGLEASLKAYTINDNNYFKLRDLGEALGFDVD